MEFGYSSHVHCIRSYALITQEGRAYIHTKIIGLLPHTPQCFKGTDQGRAHVADLQGAHKLRRTALPPPSPHARWRAHSRRHSLRIRCASSVQADKAPTQDICTIKTIARRCIGGIPVVVPFQEAPPPSSQAEVPFPFPVQCRSTVRPMPWGRKAHTNNRESNVTHWRWHSRRHSRRRPCDTQRPVRPVSTRTEKHEKNSEGRKNTKARWCAHPWRRATHHRCSCHLHRTVVGISRVEGSV